MYEVFAEESHKNFQNLHTLVLFARASAQWQACQHFASSFLRWPHHLHHHRYHPAPPL